VKRRSLRSAKNRTLPSGSRATREPKQHQLQRVRHELVRKPVVKDSQFLHGQFAASGHDLKRFQELPKEIGVMLIAAGVVGVILPGPGTPALIAGGLVLWPGAFGKLRSWLEQRFPVIHDRSMKQIDCFLGALERRYPYSRHE
jgi:hypothetical protein